MSQAKRITNKDIHALSAEDLRVEIQTLSNQLSKAKMDHVAGKLKNTASIINQRKQLARLMTVLQEKLLLSAN